MTVAIVLGLSMSTFANPNGGLFQRSETTEPTGVYGDREGGGGITMPGLPGHGETGNQPAPLGSGVAVLLGFGAAYLVGKKRSEE